MREDPTAPHPVSPKFKIMHCLRADQICLLVRLAECAVPVGLEVADGESQGMNSTRSQRFCFEEEC